VSGWNIQIDPNFSQFAAILKNRST